MLRLGEAQSTDSTILIYYLILFTIYFVVKCEFVLVISVILIGIVLLFVCFFFFFLIFNFFYFKDWVELGHRLGPEVAG